MISLKFTGGRCSYENDEDTTGIPPLEIVWADLFTYTEDCSVWNSSNVDECYRTRYPPHHHPCPNHSFPSTNLIPRRRYITSSCIILMHHSPWLFKTIVDVLSWQPKRTFQVGGSGCSPQYETRLTQFVYLLECFSFLFFMLLAFFSFITLQKRCYYR